MHQDAAAQAAHPAAAGGQLPPPPASRTLSPTPRPAAQAAGRGRDRPQPTVQRWRTAATTPTSWHRPVPPRNCPAARFRPPSRRQLGSQGDAAPATCGPGPNAAAQPSKSRKDSSTRTSAAAAPADHAQAPRSQSPATQPQTPPAKVPTGLCGRTGKWVSGQRLRTRAQGQKARTWGQTRLRCRPEQPGRTGRPGPRTAGT